MGQQLILRRFREADDVLEGEFVQVYDRCLDSFSLVLQRRRYILEIGPNYCVPEDASEFRVYGFDAKSKS